MTTNYSQFHTFCAVEMRSVLVFSCLFASCFAITLDDAFLRCKGVKRTELEPCLVRLINDLRPLIQKGIPELGLKKADIVNTQVFSVEERTDDTSVSEIFEEGNIKGLDEYVMKYLQIDYENRIALWSFLIPDMIYTGRYSMNASVSSFPLYGNGTTWNRIENFVLAGVSKFRVEDISGQLHLQEHETELTFAYKDLSMQLNNLYDGDPILQQAASVFLQKNTDYIVDVMKPYSKKVLRQLIGDLINNVLSKISLDDLAGSEFIKEAFHVKG